MRTGMLLPSQISSAFAESPARNAGGVGARGIRLTDRLAEKVFWRLPVLAASECLGGAEASGQAKALGNGRVELAGDRFEVLAATEEAGDCKISC